MIRVGVLGAAGRMGRLVCQAVADDSDLALVAGINPSFHGEHLGRMIGHPDVDVRISEELDTLLQAETEVAVDFTRPDAVMDNVRWAIDHAIHIVVGTTGLTAADLEEIQVLIADDGNDSNVVVASNWNGAGHRRANGPVEGRGLAGPRRRVASGSAGRRCPGGQDPFGSPPRAHCPPGGHLRGAGADAHHPARLVAASFVHARGDAGHQVRGLAAGPHRRIGTAARAGRARRAGGFPSTANS